MLAAGAIIAKGIILAVFAVCFVLFYFMTQDADKLKRETGCPVFAKKIRVR